MAEETNAAPTPAAPSLSFDEVVRRQILPRDPRYCVHAYEFLFEVLSFTQDHLGRNPESADEQERHVTGQELLDGIRRFAWERYGPLAAGVFRYWGVQRTEDFGEIVFNLVESGLLKKTANDTRADFAGGYTFEEAFGGPLQLK